METKPARCLINSISRFIHLVSCQTLKLMPTQKDLESMTVLMKHLKPFLDEVVDEKISPDENLMEECEKLDIHINEAREYMEKWSPKASKILCVWQSELVFTRIRSSSLEICRILCTLLRASPSSTTLTGVQNCIQEFQGWQPNRISTHIEQALRHQSDDESISPAEDFLEIIDSIGLRLNQELLKESIAIEKERIKAKSNQIKGEVDQIFRVADLISRIRDYMLKSGYFDSGCGFSIPSYFRCPLSLEIMLDPVIVASGQTFERASIQKWIDHGLSDCPITIRPLLHTNFIPNYTIKAMIVSWFEENNHDLPGKTGDGSASTLSHHGSGQDVIHTDSFRGSHHGSNSSLRSSNEIGDVCVSQKTDENFQRAISPEYTHTHVRTQSASSAISVHDYPSAATEMSIVSNRLEKVRICSEIESDCFNPQAHAHSSISERGSYSSKSMTEMSESKNSNYLRTDSFQSSDTGSDETTTYSYVEKLVEDLKSQLGEVQASAACELRLLAKHNMENRVIIGKCGAIGPLIELLYSDLKIIQEHAVTALLNLSINEANKAMIAEAGAVESLVHVLKTGNNTAKENSAAALFSLAILEDYKLKIGRSGAIKTLVNLLATGTLRGKKDAVAALFNLSICHENKARIVQAGAVRHLVELLDQDSGLVDKAIALLANLATGSEGCSAIVREGGIPMIVEILDCGSRRGKENAASTLLQLCLNSDKFCSMVLQEGSVPPLVALSQTGTPRAREKAQQLLSHFRSQRETATTGKKRIIK